jgi:cation transport regulator ChaB
MQKLWLSASTAILVAAFFTSPSDAQKGKGGGKGGGFIPSPKGGNFLPSGPGKGEPARPFDHPNSGNSLPQNVRDKLPPGLRDMPDKQPGLENHLRKLDDPKSVDPTQQDPRTRLPQDRNAARPFDHPRSGNTLPQEVRDKLPPGLRDMPNNHPGLANHLRKMGVLKDYPAVDPVPPEVRQQLPAGLRDMPYDHPGVANQLGRLGWSINEDGLLTPPTSPPTPEPFQPFNGIFRRR